MSSTINIELLPLGKKITANKGSRLADILYEHGVEFPCAGEGTCGRCRVKLLAGDIPLTKKESCCLKALDIPNNYRLSCCAWVESDILLEVSQFETLFLADDSDLDFTPADGYGIALDLGTTTLVAQLLDLEKGHVMDVKTALNPQIPYGADIIARIRSATRQNGQAILQRLVKEKIRDLIASLSMDMPEKVNRVIIVGNSVMYHIFCGFDVSPLACYPFTSPENKVCIFRGDELDLPQLTNAEIIFLPPLGSFVGSDIMAGIVASKMLHGSRYTVLVDLGTNGEIAIGNKDQIVCASTAAGPAFEGISISHGMRATSGAISSIKMNRRKLSIQTIGQSEAKGICGSGLIDAVATFLEFGKIDFSGAITSGEDRICLTPQVWITQKDIREFQLAKSAIASGIRILLDHLNITVKEVDKVYLSGAFGNFLSKKSINRVGLLDFPSGQITRLGNSALMGAKMFLFSDLQVCQNVLSKTTHISLETSADFQEIYIENMFFRKHIKDHYPAHER